MAKENKKKNEVNEFDQTIEASKTFFEKNKKTILYGGGAVLFVIIAALLIHQFYITPRNEKAAVELSKCEQLFLEGKYDKALNGEVDGAAGFLSVAEQYGSTKAGNLAWMYAGICYAQDGKAEEAIKMFEKFDDCGDAVVSPAALGALGNCYAEVGQNEKAIATLLNAAKKADNNTLSPMYLLQAGQIYESLGQNDKALECYQQIKSKYQQSMQYGEIDKYLERLNGTK